MNYYYVTACDLCGSLNGHAISCPKWVAEAKTTTNAPTDLYVVMNCGHQWRYWFGDANTIGYCTLCEIVRLMNPPLIILSGSTGNKEFKP